MHARADRLEFRVLYAERVAPIVGTPSSPRQLIFDAYGRRFDIELRRNASLSRLPGSAAAWRGEVAGMAGSWVRLTETSQGLAGLIFDGSDVYAVEPDSVLDRLMVDGSALRKAARNAGASIYRLRDALLIDMAGHCGAQTPVAAAATGLDAWQALQQELQPLTANATASQALRLGALADPELFDRFGNDLDAQVLARLNIVDGIFSSQVGVAIELDQLTVFNTGNNPFTSNASDTLLNQVRSYRNGTPAERARGLTHLFTGRDLDGDTVGVAYVGSLCSSFSAGLSEGWRSTTNAALIAAHEIGHVFGAPHDGEAGSACESTPQTFLMAPRLNGSDQFSSCSLTQIQPVVASAACLVTPANADVALTSNATSVQQTNGNNFTHTLTVTATGSLASNNVSVHVNVPALLRLDGATLAGSSCTIGGNTADCSVATLAPGASQSLQLTLAAQSTGNDVLTATASADSDSNAGNNSISVNVSITAVAPPSGGSNSGGGGGGGGGTVDLLSVLAGMVALAASWRHRRTHLRIFHE